MSGGEIILIMLFVLIFFGADKIPEVARGLGKGIREFKKAADEIKSELLNDTAEIRNELNDIRTEVVKSASDMQHEMKKVGTEVQQSSSEFRNEIKNIAGQNQDTSYEVYDELKESKKAPSAETSKNKDKPAENNTDGGDMGAYI
jgi:TatA/E family protein of Tat protein translocase